jgi:hypothetical protein
MDDAATLETTTVLPCAVEKNKESDKRREAVAVLITTEVPTVVEKVKPDV